MTSTSLYSLIAAAIALILTGIGFVIALDALWRSKGRLRRSILYAGLAMVPLLLRKLIIVFGFSIDSAGYLEFTQYADIFTALMFTLAIYQIYKIIKELDHES